MSLLHSIMRLKWTRWFGERHVSPRLCGRVHVFPGNSIGPFIFRVIWLIGRALPSDGGIFRGCTSGNFCDRYKYARAEGIEIFPPRVERASSLCVRRFLQGISTSLFDFDTENDTFEGTLWSDSSTNSVENRHFCFNQSLYTKKKKDELYLKKKRPLIR